MNLSLAFRVVSIDPVLIKKLKFKLLFTSVPHQKKRSARRVSVLIISHEKKVITSVTMKVTTTGSSTRYSCPPANPSEQTTDNGCDNTCNALDTNLPNGVAIEKVSPLFTSYSVFHSFRWLNLCLISLLLSSVKRNTYSSVSLDLFIPLLPLIDPMGNRFFDVMELRRHTKIQ